MIPQDHKTATVVFLAAALFFANTALAQNTNSVSEIFSRNLRVGDRGDDVQTLQRVLNQSPETNLAGSGPGAPGEETTYFGEFTKSAVVRFQEKYAVEILSPIQLVQGTGFVGPMTRKKLNEAAVNAGITINTQGISTGGTSSGGATGTSGSAQGSSGQTTRSAPKIISISPEKVPNGSEITITGEGFTDDNTIYTTIEMYPNVVSYDGKTLKIKLYSESINLLTNAPTAQTGQVFDPTHDGTADNIPPGTQGVSLLAPTTTAQFYIPVMIMVENENGQSEQKIIELRANNAVSKSGKDNIFAKLGTIIDPFLPKTPIAYAKNKFDWFAWAQGIANGMWSGFMSQGMGLASGAAGSPGAAPNFGGRVVLTFTCTCPIPGISYFIFPAGGLPGPYGVTLPEYPVVVKQNYAIFPGNNVLGKSYGPGTGTCGIGILAWCFQFPVARTQVVGTSLTP